MLAERRLQQGVTPMGAIGLKPNSRTKTKQNGPTVVVDLVSSESTHVPTNASEIYSLDSSPTRGVQYASVEQVRRLDSIRSNPMPQQQQPRQINTYADHCRKDSSKKVDTTGIASKNQQQLRDVSKSVKSNKTATAKEDLQTKASEGFSHIEDRDGSHYIQTPGGRRLNINMFLMNIDRQCYQENYSRCPAVMNAALNTATRFCDWVKLENKVDRRAYGLDIPEHYPLERFRQFTLMGMFRFFTKMRGGPSTIHYASTNLNRIIIAYLSEQKTVTQHSYAGVAMACIRMAIKHEETPGFNRMWHDPARQFWLNAGFGDEGEMTLQKINEAESIAVKILQNPCLTPPSPLDFLDRYLSIGGWPSHLVAPYRDLAHYLVDLTLFAPFVKGLTGSPPSLVGAAALMLSIKIHNAMDLYEKYEFWPHRLAVLTNYSAAKLEPAIKALSTLLRNKPHGEELLAEYHKTWSKKNWQ